jgi:hypothetical protein
VTILAIVIYTGFTIQVVYTHNGSEIKLII